jgi:DNA repair photolyase
MAAIKLQSKPGIQYGYSSPRWSGEFLDCSMPMTFDQYSRCSYNCLYCFSFFQRGLKIYNPQMKEQKIYTEMLPTAVNPERFVSMFTEGKSEFASYIKERIPFQWGGLSDPFDNFERKYGVGLEILQAMHKLKYPICFSTKGTWWMNDERYASLFRDNDFWNVKVSIINTNYQRAKLMEQGCPSPCDRLGLIRNLSELNLTGGITLRLRPFIIGYSDGDHGNEYLHLIETAASMGATAVSTEFFCMEGRMTPQTMERFNQMSEICNLDLIDFYRRNSPISGGYMRLNYKIKAPYINKMDALCKKLGLRFYVSDAHHKDKCCNGSCCGLSDSWNYSRGQFTEALLIAKQSGKVSWSEIANKMPSCWREINVVRAYGLNVARGTPQARALYRNFSIYDFMHYIWNHPNQPRSPYKYFHGLLYPIGLDREKDVIYEYRPYKED